ncbi:SMI1/KNR4 family protein [Bacillus sp. T33-2]|uniref:SMI1/KNR4 family protein n=1 Tax=Bacillus sp. T33-2 TaxID=2054168 RepID=UPI000C774143|nr:SMI1/KNR4 family protein [Bacillus sp. T33-2]PLR89335.1 SMI1/KNR4 family protein [Bacillus sp. T33-2]
MVKEGSIVKQTLSSLKKRLNENGNIIQVQTEEGHLYNANCTFNPPASDIDITNFEKQTGLILPTDYKEFLKITNGCRLFDDINYGGEIELYSLEKIIEYNHKGYHEYEGCYDIAYIYQDNIVVNSKLVSQNERNYLLWKDHIDQFEEARPLKMNFELWFDRFVVCQGTKFWWWSIYTGEHYYK